MMTENCYEIEVLKRRLSWQLHCNKLAKKKLNPKIGWLSLHVMI